MILLNFFTFFTSFFILVFINEVHGLESESIIGGDDAAPGKFPYHVAIEIFGELICGGAIVDEKFIITAAHCVADSDGLTKLPVKVIGGVNNLNVNKPQRVESDVEKIFIPKDFTTAIRQFNSTHVSSDIAVLRLRQPLNLSSNKFLGKIKLPSRRLFDGEKAVITGFGWNWIDVVRNNKTGEYDEKGDTYGKLRYAQTKVLTNEDCQKRFKKKIIASHICAQMVQDRGDEGVCSGDSGGPLVHNGDTLIGVVSSSPIGCVEYRRPAIYTRVSSFLVFLHFAMKDFPSRDVLSIEPIIMKKIAT